MARVADLPDFDEMASELQEACFPFEDDFLDEAIDVLTALAKGLKGDRLEAAERLEQMLRDIADEMRGSHEYHMEKMNSLIDSVERAGCSN